MILLDTNFLIRSLVKGSSESTLLISWISKGKQLCTSAVCWYEFCCGPVGEEETLLMSSVIDDQIIPFTAAQAAKSASLFNKTGRKRPLRVVSMIAAAAMDTDAELATDNTADFNNFVPFGLKLFKAADKSAPDA